MIKFFSALKGDRLIWIIIFLLSLISLLVVYSSTGTLAYKVRGGNTSYYFVKQLVLLFASFLIIFVVHRIPYRAYSSMANLALVLAVILLLLAKFVGISLNETSRWISIPGVGFNFQPSELAKLALIMHISRTLSKYQLENACSKEAFFKIIAPVGVVCFLIFLDDFSTSLLLGVVSFIMMFIGRVPAKLLLITGGSVLAFVIIVIALAPYMPSVGRIQTVRSRIDTFFKEPVTKNESMNYQVVQSKIAIAKGGVMGKGPGNSEQRNFLPHPYSDFIFAIIIEEMGLWGSFGILLLYMFLIYQAGSIVKKCSRTFPAFLVVGLSLSIVSQALINMMVSVNLIPVTGQPLPLVSMGGTSLIFTSVAFGMILSVSHWVKDPEEQEKMVRERESRERDEEEDSETTEQLTA